MSQRNLFTLIIAIVVLFVLVDSTFIVNQQQQALVLRFRESMREVRDPGLYFKLPFFDSVAYFDKRILPIEQTRTTTPDVAILADRKQIIVDAFARYQIIDPLKFFQRLNNERNANIQLNDLVNSSMRQVLGTLTMKDILSADRSKIMHAIKLDANNKSKEAGFGVEFVDVRIRRADLPEQTSQSIFARMRSERDREAKEFRAKGDEDAMKTTSTADRERITLLSEARRKAEIMRGEGDETALKLLSTSTSKDPQFHGFYRAMQAYRNTLANKDTSLILAPEGEFFQYFGKGK